MRLEGRLCAVIDLLDQCLNSPDKPADQILQRYTRTRRYIGSKDRRFIGDRFFDLLRGRARLAWQIGRFSPHLTGRLWCFAHLIGGAGAQTYDELAQLCSGRDYAPAPLSPHEQQVLRALAQQEPGSVPLPVPAACEVPDWLWPEFERSFPPGQAEREADALIHSAPVVLRVNRLKGSRRVASGLLEDDGFPTEETTRAANGLIVGDNRTLRDEEEYGITRRNQIYRVGRPVRESSAFRWGMVEIQDESSQLFVEMLDAKPGMAVLDFCAGAGGKSLALAAAMDNRGELVMTDISPKRLWKSRARLARAGVSIARLVAFDSLDRQEPGPFDRVVVDAPCSGTGTWRRQPDLRWRLTPEKLVQLQRDQQDCLTRAAAFVAPGGWLCYATCSVLRIENEDQISAFLRGRDDFRCIKTLCLSPHRDKTDGFFAVVLQRQH